MPPTFLNSLIFFQTWLEIVVEADNQGLCCLIIHTGMIFWKDAIVAWREGTELKAVLLTRLLLTNFPSLFWIVSNLPANPTPFETDLVVDAGTSFEPQAPMLVSLTESLAAFDHFCASSSLVVPPLGLREFALDGASSVLFGSFDAPSSSSLPSLGLREFASVSASSL